MLMAFAESSQGSITVEGGSAATLHFTFCQMLFCTWQISYLGESPIQSCQMPIDIIIKSFIVAWYTTEKCKQNNLKLIR